MFVMNVYSFIFNSFVTVCQVNDKTIFYELVIVSNLQQWLLIQLKCFMKLLFVLNLYSFNLIASINSFW